MHHTIALTRLLDTNKTLLFRVTFGFAYIKNRDLTTHHTKQYQTHNTMCHYKGINDLLNQIFVSSVQQNRYIVLCGVPDLWDPVHSQALFSTVTCWVGKVENITSAEQILNKFSLFTVSVKSFSISHHVFSSCTFVLYPVIL